MNLKSNNEGGNMDFNKMTKQQLKEYGETIGIKLDLKKKKSELIDELNNSGVKIEVKTNNNSTTQLESGFDIKQYIWVFIFIVLLVVNAESTNFNYAAGVVTNMIVKDGLIFTLIAWVVMTKVMKRNAWEWHDWLNALAYTTVVARIIYVVVVS